MGIGMNRPSRIQRSEVFTQLTSERPTNETLVINWKSGKMSGQVFGQGNGVWNVPGDDCTLTRPRPAKPGNGFDRRNPACRKLFGVFKFEPGFRPAK